MERKEFIEKLVEEKKSRHEVHGELISQGYSTAGYEDEYAETLKEKGVSEPQPAMPKHYSPAAPERIKERTMHIAIPKILVLFVLLAVVGGALYGILYSMQESAPGVQEEIQWGMEESPVENEEGFNFSDFLLQSKVEATAASANVSGGRMGSYDGACDDIIVVAPIECLDTPKTFSVFAPMSNGAYYCVDSNEFSGAVAKPNSALCR